MQVNSRDSSYLSHDLPLTVCPRSAYHCPKSFVMKQIVRKPIDWIYVQPPLCRMGNNTVDAHVVCLLVLLLAVTGAALLNVISLAKTNCRTTGIPEAYASLVTSSIGIAVGNDDLDGYRRSFFRPGELVSFVNGHLSTDDSAKHLGSWCHRHRDIGNISSISEASHQGRTVTEPNIFPLDNVVGGTLSVISDPIVPKNLSRIAMSQFCPGRGSGVCGLGQIWPLILPELVPSLPQTSLALSTAIPFSFLGQQERAVRRIRSLLGYISVSARNPSSPPSSSSTDERKSDDPFLRPKNSTLNRVLLTLTGLCGFSICYFLGVRVLQWRTKNRQPRIVEVIVTLLLPLVVLIGQLSVFLVLRGLSGR